MPHTGKERKRKPSSTPSKLREMNNFAENFKFSLQDPEIRKLLGDTLSVLVKELMRENEKLKERVKTLETRVDDANQYSRRTCLTIANIPESEEKDEREDTDLLVLELAHDMGVKLSPCDIGRSHRLTPANKKKKGPRDIVVRFVTYNKRAEFFRAKKNLKLIPHRKDVFINEHLTRQRAEVFFEARQLKKRDLIQGTWTYDGRICVKLDEKVHQVTTKDALNELVFGRKKAKVIRKKPKGIHQMLETAASASPILNGAAKAKSDISDTEALSSCSDEEADDEQETPKADEKNTTTDDKNVEMDSS